MITTDMPARWRDLQDEVGRLLTECGFNVQVDETLVGARGRVNIDVRADEFTDGRRNRILCECKLWNTRVPKTVVHAFRSVVSDMGANAGYVISKKGFQSGAPEAAANTNINLVTWEDFLVLMEPTWLRNHLVPHIRQALDSLIVYTSPSPDGWMEQAPSEALPRLRELRARWGSLGMVGLRLGTPNWPMPTLPVTSWRDTTTAGLPAEVRDATTWRDFEEACLRHGRIALEEFDQVRHLHGLQAVNVPVFSADPIPSRPT